MLAAGRAGSAFSCCVTRMIRTYSERPVWPGSRPSPALPGFPLKWLAETAVPRVLALSCSGGAAERIDIPQLYSAREIFHAHFSMHFSSRLAQPYHAKLCLRALVLKVKEITRLELSADPLQRCSASADRAQTGGLGKGPGVCVHAPDLYRKFDNNALLTTAIHAWRYLVE